VDRRYAITKERDPTNMTVFHSPTLERKEGSEERERKQEEEEDENQVQEDRIEK
jgi:hypothetical protein